MRYIFIIITLLMFFTSAFCADEFLGSEILQTKMNRIYFSSGVEENIFQNCFYVIKKSDDTILTGYIEESYPGISYSYPMDSLSDTIINDSCTAFIRPAAIDSLTPINIGILKSIPYGSSSNFPGLTSVTSSTDSTANGLSQYGNILHTHLYDSETGMLLDFEAGIIDAFISYKSNYLLNQNQTLVSTPAPFYIAMIPNITKNVNNRGYLTTSLYYRFNEERITTLFDGDNIKAQYSLFPNNDERRKLYNFIPEYGKKLLEYIIDRPKKISIQLQNESLDKLGRYFADVLSRDRIKTGFTDNITKADIIFKFVPLSKTDNMASLSYLLDILEKQLPNADDSMILIEISRYIKQSKEDYKRHNPDYFSKLAQRSLMEDIGVFPLLRPSLFCISNENLKGAQFDISGNIDISNLRKIIPPPKDSTG